MRPATALLCCLSFAAVAPGQSRLGFPFGIDPGWCTAYEFQGSPNACVVLAVALNPGATAVSLGPTLQCRLELAPNFLVLPLGITDANGQLVGDAPLPLHWMFSLQAIACPLPPAAPQLQPSNAVHYVFQGCWGGGASSGG